MTAAVASTIPDNLAPRTRRSLLAGAIGGIAATIAAALGRPDHTSAAAGSAMIIGSETNNAGSANTQLLTNSSVVAFKLLQNGPGTALMGYATPASGQTRGVYGRTDSPNGYGISGRNYALSTGSGAAVYAGGDVNHGVDAYTYSGERYAVRGINSGSGGVALYGQSSSGYGVYGLSYTNVGVVGDSPDNIGVAGYSGSSYGVYASSTSNYAGYFSGRVRITEQLDVAEMVAPTNPGTNTARLFVRDAGGKTQLCVIFPTGAVQIIKAEV